MYLEDIDFSTRVRCAGYRIRYFGTRWIWHESGVSARQLLWLNALLPKVWLTYLRRYGQWYERLVARPVLLVVCGIEALKRARHGQLPRGELVGMWHALSFRPPKAPVWS
jgi:GT2 family glycosyltransferase